MNIYILNSDLDAVYIVDGYESCIWTDRYYTYGDFEIYLKVTKELMEYIQQDYYLTTTDSEHLMIIEKIQIESDVEDGDHITITGRSLESILDRRIIWGLKVISGNLQDAIETLLNETIIAPDDSDRQIGNFIFEATDDSRITELTIEAQYTGDNLYDVISGICSDLGIGFKITLNDDKQFVFKLYCGDDRSYDQTANPYVVFSPAFDNLVNSNYMESKSALKNVTLIGGEGEGAERRYASTGSGAGLERRELFTDARDLSSEVDEGTLTEEEYAEQLVQRGKEKLAENVEVTSFEGEFDTSGVYRYKEDFFVGDIVQVADAYGHDVTARVLEYVISDSEEGISEYPTFNIVQ